MPRKLPNVHPGEILREEFLKPMGLSVYALAKALEMPRSRLNAICHGRRAISVDSAIRLARHFGNTAEFWLNCQQAFDLEQAGYTRCAT